MITVRNYMVTGSTEQLHETCKLPFDGLIVCLLTVLLKNATTSYVNNML